MASGSPTVHSRMKAAHSPMTRSRHFVEDSARTRIELARNNLKMEKELKKIEKQAKTAALNLSNNQQAVRMSLRQLESRRGSDPSPLLTRSARFNKEESLPSKRKLGLFANNTSLTVESTADAYRNAVTAIPGGRARSRTISGHQLEQSERPGAENGVISATDIVITPRITRTESDEVYPVDPAAQVNTTDNRSPYISTPLNVRRMVRPKLSKPFHSLAASQHLTPVTPKQPQESPLSKSCHSIRNLDNRSRNVMMSDNLSDVKGSLRLPPISPTRTVISAHHNTTDKATLKRASQLLGMSGVGIGSGTTGDGPTSFQQFYKDANSSLIVVSPPETPCGERDDVEPPDSEDEQDDQMAPNADSSISLSEMFEQIRKCRYIRHYYPNGEKPPEEAWF